MSKKDKPSQPYVDNMTLTACTGMAHAKNPKEHDLEALVASIKRFGFVAPPTIDEATKTMVAGHGRCAALAIMKADGLPPPDGVLASGDDWLVPVYRGIAFKNARERDMYLIADNQHVIAGKWNLDALTAMLTNLAEGVDDPFAAFEGMGFADIDLQSLGVASARALEDATKEKPDNGKTTVDKHDRKLRGPELNYRLIVSCRDEDHQAELMERFEAEGLVAAPLIS